MHVSLHPNEKTPTAEVTDHSGSLAYAVLDIEVTSAEGTAVVKLFLDDLSQVQELGNRLLAAAQNPDRFSN